MGNATPGGASRCTPCPYTTLFRSPGEIRLCCGENCSENPDDAANRAGLASEIDQDDADHARHDGSVHQVLPRNRRGGPQSPTEDDVRSEERRVGNERRCRWWSCW